MNFPKEYSCWSKLCAEHLRNIGCEAIINPKNGTPKFFNEDGIEFYRFKNNEFLRESLKEFYSKPIHHEILD